MSDFLLSLIRNLSDDELAERIAAFMPSKDVKMLNTLLREHYRRVRARG